MYLRVGQSTVTFDKMWELYEDEPSWQPFADWSYEDYEVVEDSRLAVLTYSNPTDRYWELFVLPDDELSLASRWDRVQDRADDEYVGVWYVDYKDES